MPFAAIASHSYPPSAHDALRLAHAVIFEAASLAMKTTEPPGATYRRTISRAADLPSRGQKPLR